MDAVHYNIFRTRKSKTEAVLQRRSMLKLDWVSVKITIGFTYLIINNILNILLSDDDYRLQANSITTCRQKLFIVFLHFLLKHLLMISASLQSTEGYLYKYILIYLNLILKNTIIPNKHKEKFKIKSSIKNDS